MEKHYEDNMKNVSEYQKQVNRVGRKLLSAAKKLTIEEGQNTFFTGVIIMKANELYTKAQNK